MKKTQENTMERIVDFLNEEVGNPSIELAAELVDLCELDGVFETEFFCIDDNVNYSFEYLDVGDTYAPTIIDIYGSDKLIVSDMGTELEKLEENYRNNADRWNCGYCGVWNDVVPDIDWERQTCESCSRYADGEDPIIEEMECPECYEVLEYNDREIGHIIECPECYVSIDLSEEKIEQYKIEAEKREREKQDEIASTHWLEDVPEKSAFSAYHGNCVTLESRYVSDGRLMIDITAIINPVYYDRLKDPKEFKDRNKQSVKRMVEIWEKYVSIEDQKSVIFPNEIYYRKESDTYIIDAMFADNTSMPLDAYLVRLISLTTGYDSIQSRGLQSPLIFYREDNPVAVLHYLNLPEDEK